MSGVHVPDLWLVQNFTCSHKIDISDEKYAEDGNNMYFHGFAERWVYPILTIDSDKIQYLKDGLVFFKIFNEIDGSTFFIHKGSHPGIDKLIFKGRGTENDKHSFIEQTNEAYKKYLIRGI